MLDGVVGESAGDALYAVFVCALVVVVVPGVRAGAAALGGLGFSCAVELLQLTDVPAELAERSTLARLALGSTFHPPDLLWYGAGAGLWWLGHRLLARP